MRVRCWKCNQVFKAKVPENRVFDCVRNNGFSVDCTHCGIDNGIVICVS